MTTSQASRLFGIPYNSLLMYVRGKYGKSLKLDQLRKGCISGPPLELLQMGISGQKQAAAAREAQQQNSSTNNGSSGNNPNKDHQHHKDFDNMSGPGGTPRSLSSEPTGTPPDMALFPFPLPPNFYSGYGSGLASLNMLSMVPPEGRQMVATTDMLMDDDYKSEERSMEDEDEQQPRGFAGGGGNGSASGGGGGGDGGSNSSLNHRGDSRHETMQQGGHD